MQMIRQITAVLAANATGEYLPPQLIYKGKTTRCHPHAKFPEEWNIWHTENWWSNEETMKRNIQKVVVPLISRKRKDLGLADTHPALALYDGFRGQTTEAVLALLSANNIVTVRIPANCISKLQPLDLTINKPMKDHLRTHFQQWYAKEVSKQLQVSSVKHVKVEVNLAVFKNPSVHWITGAWNEIKKTPQFAINGFRKAGILDAINN